MPHGYNWINTIIDEPIKQGLSSDWLMSWIKTNFKSGEKNQISNHHKVMMSSSIAKLYSTIMEQKISSCVESSTWASKFRRKHSTMDHLVSFRVIVEEIWLQGKTLIVVLLISKSFHTIPHSELWN